MRSTSYLRLAATSGAMVILVGALAGCDAEPVPFELPVPRGHHEVVIEDGEPVPLVFRDDSKIALCFGVDPARDTSRWEARLSIGGRPSPDGYAPPYARSGETVCFDGSLPPGLPEGRHRLCGRLVDRFDGRQFRVPCQPVVVRLDDVAYRSLVNQRRALLERAYELEFSELLGALDDLAGRAADAGLPMQRVQVELIAVHFLTLEGTPASRAKARQRLDALPGWIERASASSLGAMAAYQSALLHFDSGGHLEDAWLELSRADDLYRRIADPKRFTVAMEEASILHQLGAVEEAIRRLQNALEECEHLRCDQGLLESAQNNLAWYMLLNPNSSEEELFKAEEFFQRSLDHLSLQKRPLEYANRVINLAYIEVRQREDPSVLLEKARRILATLRLETEYVPYLLDWTDLVAGMAALADGRASDALEICTDLTQRPRSRLEAWAFSCMAQAHRQRGDLLAAEREIEQALLHHAYGSSQRVAQHMTLGPGYRAEEFARAARIAIERQEPETGWDLMRQLDQFSADERARRRCRERAQGRSLDEWRKIEEEIADILDTLQELDVPASRQRRAEQGQMRQEMKLRLQMLWRNWPGCERDPVVDDEGVDFRAFALEDEIILLHRSEDGVTVERRTPYPRRRLRRDFDQILDALEHQEISDAAWRRLLEPLAAALLPSSIERVGPVTTYALHGLLQGVPMSMLPLSELPHEHWFGAVTAVAVKPAGSRVEKREAAVAGLPLFVVDPRSDLPAAPRLLRSYRELFPSARFLVGEAATLTAFQEEVPLATWLHVDAHGFYDPAFPKLSALELADRPLYWMQLADTPMALRFAHLSSCQTGRWPITADSGSYGIAGLVTRLGVDWAIASRTDLDDRVAEDFNQLFYQAIASGHRVPVAYRHALRHVIELHPAGDWGGLLLLNASGAQ